MRARPILDLVTKNLCVEDKAAVEAAAERASAEGIESGRARINGYMKPLQWRRKLLVGVRYGVWETTIEHPFLMVGGLAAAVLLAVQLALAGFAASVNFINPPPSATQAAAVAADLKARGVAGSQEQIAQFLQKKGK